MHYGWLVCAAGTVLIFITMGTVSNGFSVYLPYIMEEVGLTNAQTSSLVTLRCLVSFFCMLLIGFYYEKVSLRVGCTIAAACSGAAFFLYSVANDYRTFCLGAAVSGLSYGLGSMIPVSILMNRWFVSHKALALGICASGSGIGTIVLPPLTTTLVENIAMRWSFRIESIAVFLLTVLLAVILRSSPEEMGLFPVGSTGNTESRPGKQPAKANGKPVSGLGAAQWVLLGCVSLFMGALANPGFSHLSVLFTSEGFQPMTIAVIISGVGIMITLGKLIYGVVTDSVGGYRSSLIFGFILLAGHVLCCFAFLQSLAVCVFTVLCLGIGYPIATLGPSIWAGDLANPDAFAVVVRRLQVIYAGGALVFASVPGLMADALGSYIPTYIMFSVFMGIYIVAVTLSYRLKTQQY